MTSFALLYYNDLKSSSSSVIDSHRYEGSVLFIYKATPIRCDSSENLNFIGYLSWECPGFVCKIVKFLYCSLQQFLLHVTFWNIQQSSANQAPFHRYLYVFNLWLTDGHFIVTPIISTLAHNWLCTPTSHHLTHASAASRCALVSPACTVCVTGQSVFGEADCLFCSVPVFLHSHLLFCLPVFDSRQVSGLLCWLTASFLQP